MDLKETVDMHAKKLERHDKEIEEIRASNSKEIEAIKSDIRQWNVTLNEGLARVDENSKYLREQNSQILTAIIGRNEKANDRKHELEKLKWQSVLKISLVIFGSGGLIYTIIDLLLEMVK